MNYLLNLELPLYWLFLPLVIAGLCAYKYYQWRSIFSKMKTNYQTQLREAQNRLDEALNAEGNSLTRQANKYESEIAQLKLAIRQADDNLNDVRLTWAGKAEKDAEIIRGLNAQAVEREALIVSLNKRIELLTGNLDAYTHKSNALDLKVSKWAFELDEKDELIAKLQADLTAAISVINRTGRGRKQWAKIEAAKRAERNSKTVTIINDGRIEGVIHDSLGVPTITQADQSEDFNARHIKELSSEVVRGIQEQNAAIKKELQQVDMSTLEVGDSVKFRNGNIHKVSSIVTPKRDVTHFDIELFIGSVYYSFCNNGCCLLSNALSPYDIIQIIKQPKNN